jgi:hypothetical protein
MNTLVNAQKVRGLQNTNQRIMPLGKNNLFLELHKLDHERKRLENKIQRMQMEMALIEERITTIDDSMGTMMDEINLNPPRKKSAAKSGKLKY